MRLVVYVLSEHSRGIARLAKAVAMTGITSGVVAIAMHMIHTNAEKRLTNRIEKLEALMSD